MNIEPKGTKKSGTAWKVSSFLGSDKETNKTINSIFEEAINNISEGRTEAKSLKGWCLFSKYK